MPGIIYLSDAQCSRTLEGISQHGEPMTPLVSAIISLYRGERYLPKFLENIAQQTWFDQIEFVIDHNSPSDAETDIIREFQSNHPDRLKRLTREKVVPYGASWNRCIRESSAKIVTIWNVDDLRTPSSIEVQAGPILSGEADLVFGNHITVRKQGAVEGRFCDLASVPPSKYSRNFCFGPFFMFKKDLCGKAGYVDEQLFSSADYDFAVRLSHHARIKPIPDGLGYYLNEGKGLSTNAKSRRQVEDTVIGLRYGNLDRLCYHKIFQALAYDLHEIVYDGRNHHLSDFIPDYAAYMRRRMLGSFLRGPANFLESQAYEVRNRIGAE